MPYIDSLDPDARNAKLTITPSAHVPHPATLRMLVRRAVEALEGGALKVELILGDGTRLDEHEVQQLDARFHLEETRAEPTPEEALKSKHESDFSLE